MRRNAWTGLLLTALALTGCTSGPDTTENTARGTTAPGTTAPLVAETPTTGTPSSLEEQFLAAYRKIERPGSAIKAATDDQLLAAAEAACSQMESGVDSTAVSVIDGEEPNGLGVYPDSALIAAAAHQTICP